MAMCKTFNVADLYDYHSTKQLYPYWNSKMSSFKKKGADVKNQDQIRPKQSQNQQADDCQYMHVNRLQSTAEIQLSTWISRESGS